MSKIDGAGATRFDEVPSLKLLIDEWIQSLAQVLESMTDQRPEAQWQALTGTLSEAASAAQAGPEADLLCWEQPLQLSPDMLIWVAAPRETWESAGTLTLKAAGVETVEAGEAKNTWFEILGQSLSAMARSIGGALGREVTCSAGLERTPSAETREWASATLQFGKQSLPPLLLALSADLTSSLSAPNTAGEGPVPAADPPPSGRDQPPAQPPISRTMGLLLDVDLPVSISFGKASLPMKDVLKLTTGSIVELNRGIDEHVEVLVNQCLIARGEVVVVEGNYGVRIQEIVSPQDRLRSLR